MQMQEQASVYVEEEPSEELIQLAAEVLLDWQGYRRAITYTVLASQVRSRSKGRLQLSLDDRMSVLLQVIGNRCYEAKLPLLPAIVVAHNTGYPGNRFFTTFFPQLEGTTERLLAWAKELEAVYAADYREFPSSTPFEQTQ